VHARPSRARGTPNLAERLEDAFGLVLLLLVSTYVLGSLIPFHSWGGVVITAFAGLSATVALVTARAHPRLVTWAGRMSVLAIALAAAAALDGGKALFGCAAIVQMLLLAVSALAVLRAVLTEDKVGFRTILGAVSVYITLGILFTFVYVAVDRLQGAPLFGAQHVTTGDFSFFSMTTLTTTGYGNLVPAGQPGKMFAVMEMLVGQIFLVTLIARLVSMWRPGHFLREGAGLASPIGDDDAA